MTTRSRPCLMVIDPRVLVLATGLAGAACPKPNPPPQPADECKKDGQACADNPHQEGPPPVGSQTPPTS
jgi:hypothetical protein